MNPLLVVSDAAKESWRKAGHKVELTPDLLLKYIREGLFTLHARPATVLSDPYQANLRPDGTQRRYIKRGFETIEVDDEEFERVSNDCKAWSAAWKAGEA